MTTHGDAVGPSATPAVADPPSAKAQTSGAPAAADAPKPDKPSGTVAEATNADPSTQVDDADTGAPPEPAATAPPKPEWPPTTAATTGNVVTTKSEQSAGEHLPDKPGTAADQAQRPASEAGPGSASDVGPGATESAPAGAEATARSNEPKSPVPSPSDEPVPAGAVDAKSGAVSAAAGAVSATGGAHEPALFQDSTASGSDDDDADSAPPDHAASVPTGSAGKDVSVARSRPADLAAVLAPEPPVEPPPAVGDLAEALSRLRATIGGTTYPLVMPSAEEAKRIGAALVAQLDDYLLPRLARLDAPLLVVVGGSTGAGKSTLVNSLVRAPVTKAGVLRPTTRSPVLVSHPSDSPWFRSGDLLPGLTRTAESSTDPQTLQLVSAPALGPGLALLDAPDIDSVVDRNRQLAAQLLAAADLWLFVTTAARYADAVPWELLTTARLRGTVIALVLDRVPAEAAGEISAHLAEMLTARDMGAAPIFVLPESVLDGSGMLPEEVTRPLHDWFAQLAADSNARAAVVKQTLDGALAALGPAVAGLADAADEQATAAKSLDERVVAAYRSARRTMEDGLQDGRLLRGEVLARWQEFVGTGEFLRTLESRVGQLRDRIVAAVTGRPAPGRNLQAALESQLATLLRGVASDAAEQAYVSWQAHPAGAALLEPSLQKPSPDLRQRAERVIRDWQQFVLDLVRTEAADKRVVARGAAYAVNGVGLTVMIAVFTSTAFIPTGAEVAVGAGTTVAAQKVLEAIFGDQMIRTLAARAREELLVRVNVLLDAEAARFTDRTAAVGLELEPGATLRQAAADVERSREEVALTGTPS